MRADVPMHSVVVPDPELAIDRCGIPVSLALSLLRLPLAGELLRGGFARDLGRALRLIDAQPALVRPVLEAMVPLHPLILSAGGAASRHGVQAFFPRLSALSAISLAPLAIDRLMGPRPSGVVKVLLPLGDRAREDAAQRMTSPATVADPEGRGPRLEIPLDARVGLFLASLEQVGARGAVVLPGARDRVRTLLPGVTVVREDRAARRALVDLQREQLASAGMLQGFYASFGEVEAAIERGHVDIGAHVVVRRGPDGVSTIAGRCLVMALFPADLPHELANRALDRRALAALVDAAFHALGAARAVRLVEAITALGMRLATTLAPSLGLDDLAVHPGIEGALAEAHALVRRVQVAYDEAEITDGERYGKTIDIWSSLKGQLDHEITQLVARDEPGEPLAPGRARHPLRVAALAGAGLAAREIAALGTMKGLIAAPNGEVREVPIFGSLRSGLSPHELFAVAMAARAAASARRRRERDDARLARLVRRALGAERIVEEDCRALGSIPMRGLAASEVTFATLAERVRGRVHAESGELLVGSALASALAGDPREIPLRSPIVCEARGGVCAACYGVDPTTFAPVAVGERVGLHAAHALMSKLGLVATQAFHVCVCAGAYQDGGDVLRAASPFREAPSAGVVGLRPALELSTARLPDGKRVVVTRGVELFLVDDRGVEIACGSPPPGAELAVVPGDRVARGALLAAWDTFFRHAVAEHAGVLRWRELRAGATVREQLDEVTALTRRSVVDPDAVLVAPAIEIVADDGALLQTIDVEVGDQILGSDGQRVARGELVAKRAVHSPLAPDHLEGFPDLQRALYARTGTRAPLAPIGGVVSITREPDGSRVITVRPRQAPAERGWVVRLPRGQHPLLLDGDVVAAGQPLADGSVDPGEVARILGPGVGARCLVDHIQLVYALFGVAIDVRHIEMVVRASMRFVRVVSPGAGPWAAGASVTRSDFARVCDELVRRGLEPPSAEVTMVGLWRSDPAFLSRAGRR
jgi:DNA-directed RNA polymerase subunit beta'